MKDLLNFAALSMVVLAIALTLPSWLPPMQAQSPPILLSQNVNFQPPDVIVPYNRIPGTPAGSACPADLSIIPLMPPTNIGLTLTESPTFFAYVSPNSTQVEFTLQADNEQESRLTKLLSKLMNRG